MSSALDSPPGSRRHGHLAALIMSVALTAGCYQYRAHPPNVGLGTETEGEVVWSFAWGLVQELPKIGNCNNQALAEVTVQDNFAFSLLTVVTLGLASPKRVEWRCAVAPACEGALRPDTTGVSVP